MGRGAKIWIHGVCVSSHETCKWEVHKEKCTLNKEFAYRNVGISGISLGIGGGEDSVDEHEGTNNLGSKASTRAIACLDGICTTTKHLVLLFLEALHHTGTADGSQTLHDYVKHRPRQRELPRQKQPKGHCRVNMTTCTTSPTQRISPVEILYLQSIPTNILGIGPLVLCIFYLKSRRCNRQEQRSSRRKPKQCLEYQL